MRRNVLGKRLRAVVIVKNAHWSVMVHWGRWRNHMQLASGIAGSEALAVRTSMDTYKRLARELAAKYPAA